MGQFKVEVVAVGAHGCKREVKDGETNYGCGRMDCPDCIAKEFVATLKRKGAMLESATLTHWPGTVGEVVDNLMEPYIRKGSF